MVGRAPGSGARVDHHLVVHEWTLVCTTDTVAATSPDPLQ